MDQSHTTSTAHRFPVMQGILPWNRKGVPTDIIARLRSAACWDFLRAPASELLAFGTSDDPPDWVCVYAAAIPNVDMSGAESLTSIGENLAASGVTLVFAKVMRRSARNSTVTVSPI